MQHGRIGDRLRDELRPVCCRSGQTLHDKQDGIGGRHHVDEERGIEEEVRVRITLKDIQRRADEFLLVGTGKIVGQSELDAPESQSGAGPHHQQHHQAFAARHHGGSLSVLVENALAWPRALPSVDSLRILRLAARVVIVMLGGIQVLAYPNRMSSDDVVSYLDVADAYRHHQWKAAINGYWSPLYSWVLAAGEWVMRPAASQEFSFVRLVNFTVYLLALAAFELFLRRAIAAHEHAVDARAGENARLRIPRWTWLVFVRRTPRWGRWNESEGDAPRLTEPAESAGPASEPAEGEEP